MEEENHKEHPEEIAETDLAEAQEYQKPAFICETVFETMALACGKIGTQQRQCSFNRKNS
jgi:hypothetical protein